MYNQTTLQKILYFPLTKIVIGILVVGSSVALLQWLCQFLPGITEDIKNIITSFAVSTAALISYILLFRFYEKRKVIELSVSSFGKNAIIGFSTGFILQSLIILISYLAGSYSIEKVNSVSFLLTPFAFALTAGFVAEILIRGIFFRLIENTLGTLIALIISAVVFAVLHAGGKDTTFLSVLSVTVQAGVLVSALYIYTRSLWPSIFFHFAWDFAEPGIYGGINPGMNSDKTLFMSHFSGSEILTGGAKGPVSSIQAAAFCIIASILFLWLAKQKNNFIRPYWQNKTAADH
ncbi:MAG: type II CAAX endopeptidase family protein [Bacteroidota bacterium]